MSNQKSLSKKLRILQKTDGHCAYCGKELTEKIIFNYIIPLSSDGIDEEDNLLACCCECNSRKGQKPLQVFKFHYCCKLAGIPNLTPEHLGWFLQNNINFNDYPPFKNFQFYFETLTKNRGGE